MSDTTDLKALIKLACDGFIDGEQIAANGNNYIADIAPTSAFSLELLSKLQDFAGAFPELQALDAAGVASLATEVETDLPGFQNVEIVSVITQLQAVVVAWMGLLAAAKAPAVRAAALPKA